MRWVCCSILAFICFSTPFAVAQDDSPTSAESGAVYITKTGKRYHLAHCRYLAYSKIRSTREQASQLGLTPCKVCKPGGPVSENAAPKPKVTSSRCRGITKAGKRCKRKAGANGYCWQHG